MFDVKVTCIQGVTGRHEGFRTATPPRAGQKALSAHLLPLEPQEQQQRPGGITKILIQTCWRELELERGHFSSKLLLLFHLTDCEVREGGRKSDL